MNWMTPMPDWDGPPAHSESSSRNDIATMVRWLMTELANRLMRQATEGEIQRICASWADDLHEYAHLCTPENGRLARRKFKRWPSVADLAEFFEDKPTAGEQVFNSVPAVKPSIDVDRVMRSEVGQLALREGWGRDVWVAACAAEGDTGEFLRGWDYCRIEHCRRALVKAKAAAEQIPPSPFASALRGLWDGMRDQEARLGARYS